MVNGRTKEEEDEKIRREQQARERAVERAGGEVEFERKQTEQREAGQEFIKQREKALARGATIEEATRAAEEGTALPTRTVQEVQQAQTEISQRFGEAGVFETPEIEKIIPPEQENLGVTLDIAGALIDKPLGKIEDFGRLAPKAESERDIRKRLLEEQVSETEIAVENARIDNTVKEEISKEFNKEVEFQVAEMGISAPLVLIGGLVLGGVIGDPVRQLIGSDKKVKNLETGVINLETIATDMASTVRDGSMAPAEALSRLEYIDAIIDNLEAELKLAAIESPNVRISLRGREIETKILKARTKINDAKRRVAGFEIQGIIEETPAHQKLLLLSDLQKRFEKS